MCIPADEGESQKQKQYFQNKQQEKMKIDNLTRFVSCEALGLNFHISFSLIGGFLLARIFGEQTGKIRIEASPIGSEEEKDISFVDLAGVYTFNADNEVTLNAQALFVDENELCSSLIASTARMKVIGGDIISINSPFIDDFIVFKLSDFKPYERKEK